MDRIFSGKNQAVCLLLFGFFSISAQSRDLIFHLGEKKQLPLPSDSVVHLGDQSVLSANEYSGQLILRGKSLGRTWITLGSQTHRVFVLDDTDKKKVLLLKELLKTMWGLKFTLNEEIEIYGTFNSLSDWQTLARFSQQENLSYHFRARPGEDLEPEIKTFFKTRFKDKSPPEINWQHLPKVFVPKGSDLLFYNTLLKPFGLTPQENPHWHAIRSFIKIEVATVEISHSSTWHLGGMPRFLKDQGFSFSSLLQFINFLKSSGKGRVIQHSQLLCQSGEELKIHSGGQIPFSQYNFQTQQESTNWKSYGLTLNLRPHLDNQKNILLKIRAEFSEPEALLSEDGMPPLKRQRLETSFQLKNAQIVKIFQREKSGWRSGQDGSFLLNLPFINALFRTNHNFQSEQMILIRPEIMEKHKNTNLKTAPSSNRNTGNKPK